jgi:hypothetical protein
MSHQLTLVILPEKFAVCKLDANAPVPHWAASRSLVSITRTADELSVVCPQDLVPPAVKSELDWRCARVAGTMDFAMIGVVASLVSPLAAAGVSVFVMSTFNTDYLLVKTKDWERAVEVLKLAGHSVRYDAE